MVCTLWSKHGGSGDGGVVVRAVRRNAVVMKAVPQRMDRVKEEGTERVW